MKTLNPLSLFCATVSVLVPCVGTSQDVAQVPTGLLVSSHEERYEVEGDRLGVVVAQLNEMRLEEESGELSQGLTDYRVTPEWRFLGLEEGCGITSVRVTVEVTMTLPRWRGVVHATEQEQREWSEILLRITRHEYRHRDITIEVATDLLGSLEELNAGTCTGVRRAAEAALALARAELRSRHAEFDAAEARVERR